MVLELDVRLVVPEPLHRRLGLTTLARTRIAVEFGRLAGAHVRPRAILATPLLQPRIVLQLRALQLALLVGYVLQHALAAQPLQCRRQAPALGRGGSLCLGGGRGRSVRGLEDRRLVRCLRGRGLVRCLFGQRLVQRLLGRRLRRLHGRRLVRRHRGCGACLRWALHNLPHKLRRSIQR